MNAPRATTSGPLTTTPGVYESVPSLMNRFALSLVLAAGAFAQQAPRRIVSPEVLPDHRIAFRISAPKATEVVLRFSEGGPQSHPMTKGEDGVWSVTIGPLVTKVRPAFIAANQASAEKSRPV